MLNYFLFVAMLFIRFSAKYFIPVFLCMSSLPALAVCNKVGHAVVNFTVPNIVVQRDVPVGTVLEEVSITGASDTEFESCSGDTPSHLFYSIMPGMQSAGIDHVYKTSVPGIGVKIFNSTNGYYYDDPAMQRDISGSAGIWNGSTDTVTFVKIGEVKNANLNATELAYVAGDDNLPAKEIYLSNNVNITSLACSVLTSSVGFNMGDVSVNEFSALRSTSSTTQTTDLKLDCDVDANIQLTLNGNQNNDLGDPTILALSEQGQSGVASGIGVQLLYNGTPLELNKTVNLKQSTGGQETFPFTARYIQTKEKVQAGHANATATLNLTYQ